jgi:hypothetical protein
MQQLRISPSQALSRHPARVDRRKIRMPPRSCWSSMCLWRTQRKPRAAEKASCSYTWDKRLLRLRKPELRRDDRIRCKYIQKSAFGPRQNRFLSSSTVATRFTALSDPATLILHKDLSFPTSSYEKKRLTPARRFSFCSRI